MRGWRTLGEHRKLFRCVLVVLKRSGSNKNLAFGKNSSKAIIVKPWHSSGTFLTQRSYASNHTGKAQAVLHNAGNERFCQLPFGFIILKRSRRLLESLQRDKWARWCVVCSSVHRCMMFANVLQITATAAPYRPCISPVPQLVPGRALVKRRRSVDCRPAQLVGSNLMCIISPKLSNGCR